MLASHTLCVPTACTHLVPSSRRGAVGCACVLPHRCVAQVEPAYLPQPSVFLVQGDGAILDFETFLRQCRNGGLYVDENVYQQAAQAAAQQQAQTQQQPPPPPPPHAAQYAPQPQPPPMMYAAQGYH